MFILYLSAFFDLVFNIAIQIQAVFPLDNLLRVAYPAAMAAAGFGIANERKWGYWLGVAAAALPLVARVLLAFGIGFDDPLRSVNPFTYNELGLIFEVGLFVVLVHPQSREYQRIWFR